MLAIAACVLASCATPYAPSGFLGGFDTKELREDVYRISFSGNGYTTTETAQTYWLYQCAELTLSKGYYGFEILSDMKFVMRRLPNSRDEQSLMHPMRVAAHPIKISLALDELAAATKLQADKAATEPNASSVSDPIRVAHSAPVFIYVPSSTSHKPAFEGDIHLLKKPFDAVPPKTFGAAALKASLQGYVKSDKCGLNNVCPHVHEYLFPKGKLRPH